MDYLKGYFQRVIHRPGNPHKGLLMGNGGKTPIQLLNKMVNVEAGQTITNFTKIGNTKILITRKIEQELFPQLFQISSKNSSYEVIFA